MSGTSGCLAGERFRPDSLASGNGRRSSFAWRSAGRAEEPKGRSPAVAFSVLSAIVPLPKTIPSTDDWHLLEALEIDPSVMRQRSVVFQRELVFKGCQHPVYVKIYDYNRRPFQRLWRRGRSRREARNLEFFRQLGIEAPGVLAWGERRNIFGKMTKEFIITEMIAGAFMLEEFVMRHCPDRSTGKFRRMRETIIDTLARWTCLIHEHGFFHEDLKWRNVLARTEEGGVRLFWIDCPQGHFKRTGFGRRRARLKDCATLDKVARRLCTPAERLRFVARYLGTEENDPCALAFAREVSAYRRRRFDSRDEPLPGP